MLSTPLCEAQLYTIRIASLTLFRVTSEVELFTFGIMDGNKYELTQIASDPKNKHRFLLNSFAEFEIVARRALHSGKTLFYSVRDAVFNTHFSASEKQYMTSDLEFCSVQTTPNIHTIAIMRDSRRLVYIICSETRCGCTTAYVGVLYISDLRARHGPAATDWPRGQ